MSTTMWRPDSQFGATMRQMDMGDSVQHAARWRKWFSGEDALEQKKTQTSCRKQCDQRWETESHSAYTYYVRPQELDYNSCEISPQDQQSVPDTQRGTSYQPQQYQDSVGQSAQNQQHTAEKQPSSYSQAKLENYESIEVPVNFAESEYEGREPDQAGRIVDEELKNLYGEELERRRLEKERQEAIEEKERKKREEEERIQQEKEAKKEARRKRLEKKKKKQEEPLTPAQITARKKKQEQLDKIQNSRELSNSGFAKHFKKPPFHSYGHGNTHPIKGGVMHGNYMTSYNVKPLMSHTSQKYEDIMDDVNFVYDSALLHIDPSKSGGYESSADEPEENTTLLDTVREKLRKEYGAMANSQSKKRAENRARRSSIQEQMERAPPTTNENESKAPVSSQQRNGKMPENSSKVGADKPRPSTGRRNHSANPTRAPNAPHTGVNFEKKLPSKKKQPARKKFAMECHPSSWETETHASIRRTGVAEPDDSPERKQVLQERLEGSISELCKIPMRYRRSWSQGVASSLCWNPDAEEQGAKTKMTVENEDLGTRENEVLFTRQRHQDTEINSSTNRQTCNTQQLEYQQKDDRSRNQTVSMQPEPDQSTLDFRRYSSSMPPPPPPPEPTHTLVDEEDVDEPRVCLVTSPFKPRSFRERDPRQFKYLPVEWSKVIRPAGRPVPRGDSVGTIVYSSECC